MEGGHHGDPAEGPPVPAELGDPHLRSEERPRRRCSERHEDLRIDRLDLREEERGARRDLVRLGGAVVRWTALDHVRDVHVLPLEPDRADHLVQLLAAPPHAGHARRVFVRPRTLAHDPPARAGVPDAEHDVGPSVAQLAARAVSELVTDLPQPRVRIGLHVPQLLDTHLPEVPQPLGDFGELRHRSSRPKTRSRIASAISAFDAAGTSSRDPARSRIVTWFRSAPMPSPGSVTSLATTKSRFFDSSFFLAPSMRSSVSAAKPTRILPSFRPPSSERMSGPSSSVSVRGPPPFLNFLGLSWGTKSLTAATMKTACAPSAAARTARRISSLVSTETRSTPYGSGSSTGPLTRTTEAPRFASAAATAYPILPEERFETNRTGSMDTPVGPAVTTTFFPVSWTDLRAAAIVTETIRSGSARRPQPLSRSASQPLSGSTTRTPRSLRRSRLAATAGCCSMRVFTAGATITGPVTAMKNVDRRSSAMPRASLARTLAVAGATRKASTDRASSMCWTEAGSERSKRSRWAFRPASV